MLASMRADDGGFVAGTEQALYLCTAGEQAPVLRLGWEVIERAGWDKETEQLTVVEVTDFGQPEPVHRIALTDSHLLLDLIRERITASIVARRRVEVTRTSGLTAVARRSPTRSGDISVAFVLDKGLDPNDDAVTEAVERATAALRDDLGM